MTTGFQTQKDRVLAVLNEGPCTSLEVSTETGLSIKHSSAYLTALVKLGVVKVTSRTARHERCEHCGYKPSGARALIYALVSQEAASR